MAALKVAHFAKHKLSGINIIQFYSDLCIPGKADQKFYSEAKEIGVDFIRAEVSGVSESGKGIAINYRSEDGKESEMVVDMVVLNPALEPAAGSEEISGILGLARGERGFFAEKEPDITSVITPKDGIFVAGCAQDPKDIAETIAEAEATVGEILASVR